MTSSFALSCHAHDGEAHFHHLFACESINR